MNIVLSRIIIIVNRKLFIFIPIIVLGEIYHVIDKRTPKRKPDREYANM